MAAAAASMGRGEPDVRREALGYVSPMSSSPEPERTAVQWGDAYRGAHTTYVDLTERLEGLVKDLLRLNAIDCVQVESRAKTVDSFMGKLDRKKGQYKDPLREVTDLAGVRVIAYYLEDVTEIGELIAREFAVDEANSVDKAGEMRPNEFGYRGVSYVVSLGDSRRDLPEWASFRELKAEIQVRTAAQHAWAAVDHKLNYKSPHDVPDQLKRRFSRLSAIFELADDQFSQLRREHAELAESYSESVRGGDLDIALDATSLGAYLDSTERLEAILEFARGLGWHIRERSEDPDRADRYRKNLGRTVQLLGVETVGELDRRLADPAWYESALRRLAAVLKTDALFPLNDFPDDLLSSLLLVDSDVSADDMAEVYAQRYAKLVVQAQRTPDPGA